MLEMLFVDIAATNMASALLPIDIPAHRQNAVRNMEHAISRHIVRRRAAQPRSVHVVAARADAIHLSVARLEPFLVLCFVLGEKVGGDHGLVVDAEGPFAGVHCVGEFGGVLGGYVELVVGAGAAVCGVFREGVVGCFGGVVSVVFG